MSKLEEFHRAKRNNPSFKQFRPSVTPHGKDYNRNKEKQRFRNELKNMEGSE